MEKTIEWGHGQLSVQALGSMIGPVEFKLPDGRCVSPFQVAPWGEDEQRIELPGILQRLRGEWPCVPFGTDALRELPENWPAVGVDKNFATDPHGFSANHNWEFDQVDSDMISMSIRYPDEHPIEMLRRTITPDPTGPALDFELEVIAREACDLSFGLHPTFKVSGRPGDMRIDAKHYDFVHSFPGDVEPGAALFAPNRVFEQLENVTSRNGQQIDATQLPLPDECEDLLQIVGINGEVSLEFDAEKYAVHLNWQKEHFGSLLLWYSNKGRKAYPWNGRHQALGMEPICGAFDLGPSQSKANNPISESGTPTTIRFEPSIPFKTKYRIAAAPL
ncbi:hypothetical protein [Maritalea sp. S77]|uniref:hypothetical protein n=1 Tax=Maritalea sp. S77 TaxID=3415125 RepID=UPI003C7C2C01